MRIHFGIARFWEAGRLFVYRIGDAAHWLGLAAVLSLNFR